MLGDTLDGNLSLLIFRLADSPLDNPEVDSVLLASINALAEGMVIEKMTDQTDCVALQIITLRLSVF